MSATSINGDITTVESGIIIHGVNCQGRMASGVAKAIKTKWPKVLSVYLHDYQHNNLKLGNVSFVEINSKLIIANACTQEYYGKDGKQYVSYEAVQDCFNKVAKEAKLRIMSVHYPAIGAGLGGGDWSIIQEIINDELEDIHHTLWKI